VLRPSLLLLLLLLLWRALWDGGLTLQRLWCWGEMVC
jgi:hypothetical protein